jgi:hypothetical protein
MRPHLLHVALLALAVGCTDGIASPTIAPTARTAIIEDGGGGNDPCTTGNVDQVCEGEPAYGTGSWNFFAPVNDILYQAAGDPSPGAAGIWLGWNVTPSACFNDKTSAIIDIDHDWLDDRCELELARGFAPRWSMGHQDNCPDGEPAWAAKYFPASGAVRIAFMPAYYNDCGTPSLGFGGGHPGDSELVMEEVIFNPSTQHWQLREMWLSAHHDAWLLGHNTDRSQWVDATEAEYSTRYLGYPKIAVSANKHANYKNDSKCNNNYAAEIGAGDGDSCYSSYLTPFRFPIDPARNAGSRFVPLMGTNGCVTSIKTFAGNGIVECFFGQARSKFSGWQLDSGGETSYRDLLMGELFEFRYGDGGPGPAPYAAAPPPDDPPPVGGCDDPTQIICTSNRW